MPVSKTDFVRGLQCEKMLWLDAHAPERKIIPPQVQARLDAGNAFGDNAMSIFGAFTETSCFKEDGRLDYAAMLTRTKALLDSGENVICEAAFSWYGNYCAADILKKDGQGYALYEVKNTDAVREEFLLDLGFQRLILRKNGVVVTTCALVLRGDTDSPKNAPKNASKIASKSAADTRETTLIKSGDTQYKIVDVTREARAYERTASLRIFELGKLKKKDTPCPCVDVGEQCDKPYRCWYYEYCHP